MVTDTEACPSPLDSGAPYDPEPVNPLRPRPASFQGPIAAPGGGSVITTRTDRAAPMSPECEGSAVAQPVYEAVPPPPPPPPPEPMIGEGGDEESYGGPRRPTRAGAVRGSRVMATPAVAAAGPGLGSVQLWTAANGTLSTMAFQAIVGECGANWGGLTSDCAAAVKSGTGAFAVVPTAARDEFAFLFQQDCPADRSAEQCLQKMEANRLFRSLARAKLDPQPTTMKEGVRTRFTARLRDSGTIRGLSGVATNEGSEGEAAGPGQTRLQTLIPYAQRMCFGLTSEDPAKATIEVIADAGAVVEQGKLCMDMNAAGDTKYEPSWWVTPTSGDDLRLLLDAEYVVRGAKHVFRFQPRPIVVDVTPAPGLWDQVDAFVRRATGTVNLAVGLAQALGALFAAIAGWALWTWFKRKQPAGGPG